MVGRLNGYDYKSALANISDFAGRGLCDGIELMMLQYYYWKADDVAAELAASGVPAVTIHCEKEVGTLFSKSAKAEHDGDAYEAGRLKREAFSYFRLNCAMGEKVKVSRMVLHLWGGRESDWRVGGNISFMPELNDIAAEYGLRLLVENVPSSSHSPRCNWHRLLPFLGQAGLIFDTRFGKLHEEIRETLTDSEITPLIEHIHISDFAGTYRDFAALRPILQPGEGSIDFAEVADLLDAMNYNGTVTLESPVMTEDGLNVPALEKTLKFLRGRICEKE